MRIIGLTGSIGMGKSVLASQFRFLKIPVHDADACVHELMKPDGAAFKPVADAFPEVIDNGQIDRRVLGKIVFDDNEKRHQLEQIIHPLVRQSSAKFVGLCRKQGHKICVMDIPLLFEIGAEGRVHEILCVTAPAFIQKRRVMRRPNMGEEKFKAIVKAQMPDYRKRTLSDIVINSARGKRHTLAALKRIKK